MLLGVVWTFSTLPLVIEFRGVSGGFAGIRATVIGVHERVSVAQFAPPLPVLSQVEEVFFYGNRNR
jgi:hypothetical protein